MKGHIYLGEQVGKRLGERDRNIMKKQRETERKRPL